MCGGMLFIIIKYYYMYGILNNIESERFWGRGIEKVET